MVMDGLVCDELQKRIGMMQKMVACEQQ